RHVGTNSPGRHEVLQRSWYDVEPVSMQTGGGIFPPPVVSVFKVPTFQVGPSVPNVGVMEYWNDGCGKIRQTSLIYPSFARVVPLFQ
ncbi:MAG: hypothetical protein PVH81_11905, partial [Syntrophobacterales bacterium]